MMIDMKVTRAEAAEARRDAIRIKDGDVTPAGIRLTRYSQPLDVGTSRRLPAPMQLRTVLHHRAGCESVDGGEDGRCIQCWSADESAPAGTWVKFTGIASVSEIPYEMWDIFGPYTERVAANAFEVSLASNPDVAFLCNHTGITMARTTHKSLLLQTAPTGLAVEAWANYERSDVRDFTIAVRDGCIDQMSFAAYLEEGEWNDDCTEFTMTRLDLHCGDVSGVNFGANPYTSLAARAHRVLEEVDRLPAGAARFAMRALEARLGAVSSQLGGGNGSGLGAGRSLALVRSALLADDED